MYVFMTTMQLLWMIMTCEKCEQEKITELYNEIIMDAIYNKNEQTRKYNPGYIAYIMSEYNILLGLELNKEFDILYSKENNNFYSNVDNDIVNNILSCANDYIKDIDIVPPKEVSVNIIDFKYVMGSFK